ncbi:hypothetical protein [Prescottella equi]|uniref:hypothetical protein n=1 Tax=Rhodococcus hoagii TaxID=43767 RepID=UPI001584C814|nr:hypothetical protein [Prescottella equi]
MTDMITPASLLEHAAWIDGCGHGLGPGEALRAEAARLEAESARDEEARRLAIVAVQADGETLWGDLLPEDQADVIVQMRAVLDRLAADGRLLPEGGTVLTAEQVADLRWLMAQYVGFDGDIDCPPYASLDALFTPPAVAVPDSGPDGTPEKPWPTWQDVPNGVEVVPTGLPERFVKVDSCAYIRMRATDAFKRTTVEPIEFAPFVRVDGDHA